VTVVLAVGIGTRRKNAYSLFVRLIITPVRVVNILPRIKNNNGFYLDRKLQSIGDCGVCNSSFGLHTNVVLNAHQIDSTVGVNRIINIDGQSILWC
jgi:tartrate dehydratase alpha subunit/fumarate hydratase class I-like protein